MRLFAGVLVLLTCGSLALGCGSGDESGDPFSEEPPPPSPAEILASDKVAETGARAAVGPLEVYAADHHGSYLGATIVSLRAIDPSVPEGVGVLPQVMGYSVMVTSKVSATQFTITRAANRSLVFSCSAPGTGDCSAKGTWGT